MYSYDTTRSTSGNIDLHLTVVCVAPNGAELGHWDILVHVCTMYSVRIQLYHTTAVVQYCAVAGQRERSESATQRGICRMPRRCLPAALGCRAALAGWVAGSWAWLQWLGGWCLARWLAEHFAGGSPVCGYGRQALDESMERGQKRQIDQVGSSALNLWPPPPAAGVSAQPPDPAAAGGVATTA